MRTASGVLRRAHLGSLGAGLAFGLVVAAPVVLTRGLPSLYSAAPVIVAAASEDGADEAETPETAAIPDHLSRLDDYRRRVSAFQLLEARLFGSRPRLRTALRSAAAAPHVRVARGGSDLECLTQAVYYEARGEPADGQSAVAQVVLNRLHDPRYPKSVCGVVFQGAERRGCQFSFACEGVSSRRGVETAAWTRSQAVAASALGGGASPAIGPALNYHADYVHPTWAQRLSKVAAIGRHIFYQAIGGVLPPGATAPAAPDPGKPVAD